MTVSYCASTGSAQKTESGATLETWGKLPDTMHLLAPRSKEEMEAELSDAGFFLGAGYLFRWYHSPGSRMEHRYRNMYSVIADVENATYEPLAFLLTPIGSWTYPKNTGRGNGNSTLRIGGTSPSRGSSKAGENTTRRSTRKESGTDRFPDGTDRSNFRRRMSRITSSSLSFIMRCRNGTANINTFS